MKNIIIMLVMAFTFFSCDKQQDCSCSPFPKKIEPVLIGKGDIGLLSNMGRQNLVIYNQNDFNNMLIQMNNVYNIHDISHFFTQTIIDFDNYQVIGVFSELRPTAGGTIDIVSITENQNNIRVDVERLQQDNDATRVNQPFHIVKIPKTSKPIIFE